MSQRTGGQTWTAAVGNRAEETTGMCEERSCPEEGQSEGGNPPEFEAVKDDGYANDAPARSVGGVAGGSKTGLSGWKGVIGRRESIFLALLVFLFGDNIVSRIAGWGAPKDSGNHADDPPRPIMNRRFHATYSFRKAPFVHPKIVDDLIGNLSDTGEQVVAINLLDSQDSNRYFGEILVAPQADPMEPSWPWVYSVEGEGSDDQRSGDSGAGSSMPIDTWGLRGTAWTCFMRGIPGADRGSLTGWCSLGRKRIRESSIRC